MGKQLHLDPAAEKEAIDIGTKFMNSSDVVGDMSRAYGADLSSVRIHTDEGAAHRAAERGVDAFSTGKDVFFAQGAFNRSDPASRGLLAHELSHSLQQGVGGDMGAMTQSAPMGAEQGGILDWFRSKFGRKKKMEISEPERGRVDDSADSLAYMNTMRGATMKADEIQNRLPQARPGRIGSAEALAHMKDVFWGSGDDIGTIARANQSVDTAEALVKLGLRTSSTDEAKANGAYRGELLSGFADNLIHYMKNLESGGMDMEYGLAGTKKVRPSTSSAAAYVYGGNIDQINQDMLTMVGQYASSDQGVEYLKNAAEVIGGANAFGGDQKEVLHYLLKSMFNMTGAAYQQLHLTKDVEFDKRQHVGNVAQESLRTVLCVPNFGNMDDEELKTLPPQMRPLVKQYQALVAEIQEKMSRL